MTVRMKRSTFSLLAAAGGLLFSAALQAQDLTVRGRVIGPDNAGLDSQRVVLHRVARDAGATIAETLTGANGAFQLNAPLSGDTAALLFVAVRYQGELYIGPPFRETESGTDQVIQVGVPGTSASAVMGGTGAAPAARPVGRATTTRSWLLWLIPLLGVAAVALYAIVPRSRVPAGRALMIRLAEVDERMEAAPDAQREQLRDERQRLVALLRPDRA